MESRQSIKNRIKSIEGTQQITKSMRLVAIAKMQKAREHMDANHAFLEGSGRLAAMARQCMDGEKHPYIEGRPVQNTLMVVISGDRGLCGGYNAGIIRFALHQLESLGRPAKVLTIGSKASDAFRRRQSFRPIRAFKGITDSPIYSEAAEIAQVILEQFNSGEVDEVLLCHTRFVSMLTQDPEISRLLPLGADQAGGGDTGGESRGARGQDAGNTDGQGISGVSGQDASGVVTFEPAGLPMLEGIISFYLTARIFGAILESAVSEQGARILSMDGASRTAGEMIANLTLRYNQVRQGAITQELTEIVAGADAVGGNIA
ncbi:MAG: ATP synthase F1 subunit gamma [Clostridiales bacterium]|nr:ATP synthase F1 subunit gamma [Clostridiales bacterium]